MCLTLSHSLSLSLTLTNLLTLSLSHTQHIFIFISQEGFLLDKGIRRKYLHTEQVSTLRDVHQIFPHISVVFTTNIGSYRKLLPLLARKWFEDCAIVTVDDHLMYPASTLRVLVEHFIASNGTFLYICVCLCLSLTNTSTLTNPLTPPIPPVQVLR